jgi:hypothetical protein
MMKNGSKMALGSPNGPFLAIFRTILPLPFPSGQKNEKIGSNKAFHLTRHKWRDGER